MLVLPLWHLGANVKEGFSSFDTHELQVNMEEAPSDIIQIIRREQAGGFRALAVVVSPFCNVETVINVPCVHVRLS